MDTPPRNSPRLVLTLSLGALAGLVLLWLCAWLAADEAPQAPATTSPAQPTGPAPLETMQAVQPAEAASERSALAPAPADTPATPTFTALVERLVDHAEATTAAVQADEIEAARASDNAARATLDELLGHFADAGERALDQLTTIPATSEARRDVARRLVLQLVLGAEFARRGASPPPGPGPERATDGLTSALLAALPQQAPLAELGTPLLEHQPHLRLCHEPAVLDLCRRAGQGEFPRPLATRLLLTLWANLQASGERSSADQTALAMLLLDDPDPSQRLVACRQLLADPRHRQVVLAWLRDRRDRGLAGQLAEVAARELPPAEALLVLRELAPLLPNQPGAYLALGHRAPSELADAYRQLLAENTHAATRQDLVAGLAMGEAGTTLPTLELALANDPNPAVRVQAMLTLTVTAAATHGERACERVLDDPALANDPVQLGLVVFALQNLEAAGLVNAIDRLGQRLRAHPLQPESRDALEQLLARALPGGHTSDGQAPERQQNR